jgi:hypothetical protein
MVGEIKKPPMSKLTKKQLEKINKKTRTLNDVRNHPCVQSVEDLRGDCEQIFVNLKTGWIEPQNRCSCIVMYSVRETISELQSVVHESWKQKIVVKKFKPMIETMYGTGVKRKFYTLKERNDYIDWCNQKQYLTEPNKFDSYIIS